jgi:hypothetical protein
MSGQQQEKSARWRWNDQKAGCAALSRPTALFIALFGGSVHFNKHYVLIFGHLITCGVWYLDGIY